MIELENIVSAEKSKPKQFIVQIIDCRFDQIWYAGHIDRLYQVVDFNEEMWQEVHSGDIIYKTDAIFKGIAADEE